MIPIPSSIADVTPPLCRRVFVEILGGKIGKPFQDKYLTEEAELWDFPNGSNRESMVLATRLSCYPIFQPFTRIQDAKLLDDWLENNELSMTINKKPDAVNGEYIFEVLIYSDVDYREINVQVYADTEEMARACAIIDAYNRRNHEK